MHKKYCRDCEFCQNSNVKGVLAKNYIYCIYWDFHHPTKNSVETWCDAFKKKIPKCVKYFEGMLNASHSQ